MAGIGILSPTCQAEIQHIHLADQATTQPAMERYTIIVDLSEGEPFRLLVPFQPALSVSALANEVKKRLSRLEILSDESDITLHLGDANGPMLDGGDALGDVILDPKSEEITVSSRAKKAKAQDKPANVSPQSFLPHVQS